MTNQQIILVIIAALATYSLLLWSVRPFRELNIKVGLLFFGLLPEKMRVVFTIPELRKKIFFTLGLLAIYRIGWQIPLPVVDPEQAGLGDSGSGLGGFISQVSLFSAIHTSGCARLRQLPRSRFGEAWGLFLLTLGPLTTTWSFAKTMQRLAY